MEHQTGFRSHGFISRPIDSEVSPTVQQEIELWLLPLGDMTAPLPGKSVAYRFDFCKDFQSVK